MKEDKQVFLKKGMEISWLITVFFSFWYQSILSFSIPLIGTVSPFRIFLPVTLVLYVIWGIREKDFSWKESSALEKWCYLLIALLLVYGAVSIPRAMEFGHTFRRVFNLTLDLCFFFLMLRLCRDKKLLHKTLCVIAIVLVVHVSIGFYESFHGGVFSDVHINHRGGYIFKDYTLTAVVSYGNPNDYASSMLMCTSVLLLAICRKKEYLDDKRFYAAAIWLPILYAAIRLAQGRLVALAFYVLLMGFVGFILYTDRKRIKPLMLSLVLMLGVYFVNEYRVIEPNVQKIWVEMQTAWLEATTPETPPTDVEPTTPETPPTDVEVPPADVETPPTTPVTPPTLSEETLKELEVIQVEKEGLKSSDFSRMRLLKHALSCFVDSYGLGVGLGNTEMKMKADNPDSIYAIHCFIARIVADCGVFMLIPLCAIVFLLLKRIWKMFYTGLRGGDKYAVGFSWLFLCTLLTYPFTSTASSDSQDLLGMWIYLAAMVLFACESWTVEDVLQPTEEMTSAQ